MASCCLISSPFVIRRTSDVECPFIQYKERMRKLVPVLAVLALVVPGGAVRATGSCPAFGTAISPGTLGQVETSAPYAGVGASGLAVSRYDSDATSGQQIAWVIGDRQANEAAGPDLVFLFGYDVRDGSLAVRYPLNPSVFPDDPTVPGTDGITNLTQTAFAKPDFEELALNPSSTGGPGKLWLFDTGDNENDRPKVFAYALPEPDLIAGGTIGPTGGSDPGLDAKLTGSTLTPTRYPIKLWSGPRMKHQVKTNVEAAFVDPATPGKGSDAIVLIAKTPTDPDGDGLIDDYRVFSFTTRKQTRANAAVQSGWVDLGDASVRVNAAAISEDGSQVLVRGGSISSDAIGLWNRPSGSNVLTMFNGHPTPDCMYSYDTATGSNVEESIAFDVTYAGQTGYDGLAWTHDGSHPPPLELAPNA